MADSSTYNVIVSRKEITVRLESIGDFFNAPAIDPFSPNEVDVLGQSAMDRITTRILARRLSTREIEDIRIFLPAAEVGARNSNEAREAIQRYCEANIEENKLQIGTIIAEALRKLAIVIAFLAVLIIGTVWLWNRFDINSDSVLGTVVTFSVCILAWITIWDPVASLAFDWIPYFRENNVLARILGMKVEVLPLEAAPNQ